MYIFTLNNEGDALNMEQNLEIRLRQLNFLEKGEYKVTLKQIREVLNINGHKAIFAVLNKNGFKKLPGARVSVTKESWDIFLTACGAKNVK